MNLVEAKSLTDLVKVAEESGNKDAQTLAKAAQIGVEEIMHMFDDDEGTGKEKYWRDLRHRAGQVRENIALARKILKNLEQPDQKEEQSS